MGRLMPVFVLAIGLAGCGSTPAAPRAAASGAPSSPAHSFPASAAPPTAAPPTTDPSSAGQLSPAPVEDGFPDHFGGTIGGDNGVDSWTGSATFDRLPAEHECNQA